MTNYEEGQIIQAVESGKQYAKALGAILGVVTTIALGMAGWSLLRVISNSERIAVIESNRFSANDAATMMNATTGEISKLVERMHVRMDENMRLSAELRVAIARLEEKLAGSPRLGPTNN